MPTTSLAGHCSQHCEGRGKSQPTVRYSGEMGLWEATGHCPPEIQRDPVHIRYPPVPTPPPGAYQWRLSRTLKILGVTLDTHFTFGPNARDCVKRVSRAPNVMKALTGSSWGFTTETLVATYKAIVRPILNYMLPPSGSLKYPPPIWTKLRWSRTKPWGSRPEAIKRPRRPTSGQRLGCSLRAHLDLCWQQFYASALQTLHPSHLIVTSPPPQGYPPGIIPPHTPRPASQRWRPQRPHPPHIRGQAGRGRLSLAQTLPPRPDDRGNHPVPGTQQGASGSLGLYRPLHKDNFSVIFKN